MLEIQCSWRPWEELMRSMQHTLIALSLCGFVGCLEGADGTVKPADGSEPTAPAVDDTMLPVTSHKPATPVANLGPPGEIAFGTMWFDGSKQSGTSNFSSAWNAASQWYEITISGESYFYLSYATMVSSFDAPSCRPSSVGGKLLVICTNAAGAQIQSRFSFVTFKP
jgi:hypothetical protein